MSRSLSEIQNSLLIFLNKTAQNVSTVNRTVSCNKDIICNLQNGNKNEFYNNYNHVKTSSSINLK